MVIYVIVCSENLKIYVGQHKREDDLLHYMQQKMYEARKYLSRRSHLYAAMRKYPRDSWSIHPLVSGIEDKKELDETEQLLIYALKSQHPDIGYNICDGGEGFRGPHSEETKRKISEEHKQSSSRWHKPHGRTPEALESWRAKVVGQKRTAEQTERISFARKGKGTGDRNANHRDGLSEEHKRKIGEANRKTWTPERRAAQAEILKCRISQSVSKHQ